MSIVSIVVLAISVLVLPTSATPEWGIRGDGAHRTVVLKATAPVASEIQVQVPPEFIIDISERQNFLLQCHHVNTPARVVEATPHTPDLELPSFSPAVKHAISVRIMFPKPCEGHFTMTIPLHLRYAPPLRQPGKFTTWQWCPNVAVNGKQLDPACADVLAPAPLLTDVVPAYYGTLAVVSTGAVAVVGALLWYRALCF